MGRSRQGLARLTTNCGKVDVLVGEDNLDRVTNQRRTLASRALC